MAKDREVNWDKDRIEDSLHQHPSFVQKVVELFPDGPPSEEISMVIMQAEIDMTLQEILDGSGLAGEIPKPKFNTDTRFEIDSPDGSNLCLTKQGKSWRLVVTSPKSPNGKYISITQVIPGDKVSAMIGLGLYLTESMSISNVLRAKLNGQHDVPTEQVPQGIRKVIEVLRHPDERVFDEIYAQFNDMVRSKLNLVGKNLSDIGADNPLLNSLEFQSLLNRELLPQEVIITTVMHLHEFWRQRQDTIFSEEMEQAMAKNNGAHIWWLISGGRKPMNKVINTLQSNRHFLVLANDETCYLRIQQSEMPFVQGLAKEYNCRAKLCDAPEYGETPCGKLHMNVGYHQRKCNACSRAKANADAAKAAGEAKEARETAEKAELEAKLARQEATSQNKAAVATEPAFPSTSSPDGKFNSGVGSIHPRNPVVPPRNDKRAEEKEWASKNGEVITVQGAKVGIDPMDFTALAEDYRRISDELLERANYYSTLAERYEALLQPSDKVVEAERQLAEAKASEESDRNAKLEALMSLITEGPPEA